MKRLSMLELKAVVKNKKQEVKHLKKVLRQTTEKHKEKIEDFTKLLDITLHELEQTQNDLKESLRKKWYQFIEIKEKEI